MLVAGIDPGLRGGIAWCLDSGRVEATPMPDTEGDIIDLLVALRQKISTVYIEDVPRAIFGAGAAQLAVLHRNIGFLEGALMALHFSVIHVSPVSWQKTIKCRRQRDMTQTQWKNKLKGEAQRRFPGIRVTLSTADALLILAAAMMNETH